MKSELGENVVVVLYDRYGTKSFKLHDAAIDFKRHPVEMRSSTYYHVKLKRLEYVDQGILKVTAAGEQYVKSFKKYGKIFRIRKRDKKAKKIQDKKTKKPQKNIKETQNVKTKEPQKDIDRSISDFISGIAEKCNEPNLRHDDAKRDTIGIIYRMFGPEKFQSWLTDIAFKSACEFLKDNID